jgi:hypothetical protein
MRRVAEAALFVAALFALFALALYARPARGQCPGGVCYPGGPAAPMRPALPFLIPVEPVAPPAYRWEPAADRPGTWFLWLGAAEVGEVRPDGWHPTTRPGYVRAEPVGEPPVPPPDPAAGAVGQLPPGGVDWDKVPAGEHYSVSGRPADRRQAVAAIGADGVPDDAGLPYLVCIGSDSDRERFRREAAGLGVPLRLKDYPAAWKGSTDYPPGLIHLQAPNGRPLLSWRENPGPDRLRVEVAAKLAEYNPTLDPGPGKPYPWPVKPTPPPAQPDAPPAGPSPIHKCGPWCVAALLALYMLRRWLNRG